MAVLRWLVFLAMLALVGWGCLALGRFGARTTEETLRLHAEHALAALDLAWAEVDADGLRLTLAGHAPDPFAQELARRTLTDLAPLARVVDLSSASLPPPPNRAPLAVTLLRSDGAVTLTGQVHGEAMRARLVDYLATLAPGLAVHDLLGTGAVQPPADWGREIRLAAAAAALVPRARVEMRPGMVSVAGVPATETARRAVSERLLAGAGAAVRLDLDLDLPPEPIVPFALGVWKDGTGRLRLDRCAARSTGEAAEIVALLRRAGLADAPAGGAGDGGPGCPVGLGGPRGNWVAAVAAGLEALAHLPVGHLSLEYRDLRLRAPEETALAVLTRARRVLAAQVPAGFEANLTVSAGALPGETASPLGPWLRLENRREAALIAGLMPHDEAMLAAETLAVAAFGRARLRSALEVSEAALPSGWLGAALAAVDAVAALETAEATLTPGRLVLTGVVATGAEAGAVRAALLERVAARSPALAVSVDLEVGLPAPPEAPPQVSGAVCAARLNALVAERAVRFAPGSAVIETPENAAVGDAGTDTGTDTGTESGADVLPALAALLRRCPDARLEIGGHTDAQGPAELNLRLSRARAEAVRTALVALGVSKARLKVKGYGETVPVADNATREGRALNRRIAFRALDGVSAGAIAAGERG